MSPDEADEFRTRLLAGFRWILVDEYQDVGPDQYALISALAGRTISEEDDKLGLFAVGDDDQNIYSFNGSSVEFIRRFESDYGAKPVFLTENYRSTSHIISASNQMIEPARQRMKAGQPILVNRARSNDPFGGDWATFDPVTQGRVQVLPTGEGAISQASAVIAELKRMSGLATDWDWSSCAVVAREWSYLDPVRSLCELEGIPVQLGNEDFSGLWRLRETQAMLRWLDDRGSKLVSSDGLYEWLDTQTDGPWIELLREAVDEHALEAGGAEVPVEHFIEWLAEWAREVRRRQRGLLLITAHRAKGLEFDHVAVLDGGWDRIGPGEDGDAPRRLYYVAMTRARNTLTLARLPSQNRLQAALIDSQSVLWRSLPDKNLEAEHELSRKYVRLSLRDVFLSFAGYRASGHPVHQAIARLFPGDELKVKTKSNYWELLDSRGIVVGRLAGNFEPPPNMNCKFATVLAITTWDRESSEPQYRERLRCDTWEVVVPELVFEPVPSDTTISIQC